MPYDYRRQQYYRDQAQARRVFWAKAIDLGFLIAVGAGIGLQMVIILTGPIWP